MSGFATVISDIGTIMTTAGYTKLVKPYQIIPSNAIADKSWSYKLSVLDAERDLNNAYINRLDGTMTLYMWRRLNSTNEEATYETLITAFETVIKALETKGSWTAGTLLNVQHKGTIFDYDNNNQLATAEIELQLQYNI